jgi:hypothetical protein
MPRPELIGPTYQSFQERMPWLDFKKMTLFLSVDRLPDTTGVAETAEVIRIARTFFGKVVCRNEETLVTNIPNFSLAVQWLFTNANSEFVFHLEDDWLLLSDIPESIGEFFDNEKIMQVSFRAWKISNPRFCLSPNIMRTSFCNLMAKSLNPSKNPENQIRAANPYKPEDVFIYWPFEEEKVILQDTGRTWMKKTNFARGGDEFTKWNIVRNPLALEREQKIRDQNAEIDRSKL